MKEFTNEAGNVTSFAWNVNFLLPSLVSCPVQRLKRFGKFCETIFTPKEWVLSKKWPKEGERVARGHLHERVGETPVH